jgi:hypothetical protein
MLIKYFESMFWTIMVLIERIANYLICFLVFSLEEIGFDRKFTN